MALVALRHWKIAKEGAMDVGLTSKNILKTEKGQLSVFLGICLLIIMSLLAFVINVGLFVKAKINLQNAVDAAAWSGAAVQARQLTNIAYVNWELRNTYKEWMFKYYVLGQASLPRVQLDTSGSDFLGGADPYTGQPGNGVNFRTPPFFKSGDSSYDSKAYDKYNIPSVCLHLGGKDNICAIYSSPGLPRFQTAGLPGVGDAHEKFLDSIVSQKAKNCSSRSDLNFGVTMAWLYGTGSAPFPGLSGLAMNRLGAWPQSLELALRMRNLEMIVNRPPVINGICRTSGAGCMVVDDLENESKGTPLNERPVKAFWAGYRNLSGGENKNSDILANSFTLFELRPTPFTAGPDTLSGYLIPQNKTIGQSGILANQKHYLDLQVLPLNLVTFFTSFVTNNSKFEGSTDMQASCPGSKTAIPVPGYIMGFIKNPRVLTYYSVKAEAKFVGLFFPFTETGGITLRAYATAKPFGGRIGPRLFSVEGKDTIVPRSGAIENRSAPYISAIKPPTSTFKAGYPIPTTTNFWVKDSSTALGGTPKTTDVYFAIPNLLYDFSGDVSTMSLASGSSQPIMTLNDPGNELASQDPKETLGLYNKDQFISFAKNMEKTNGTIDNTTIDNSLNNIRKPTRYEALNYLIPNVDSPGDNLEGQAVISKDFGGHYKLYAPLFGDDFLYINSADVENVLMDYINKNRKAIDAFTDALKDVATAIKNSGTTQGVNYLAAAKTIHNLGSLPSEVSACSSNLSLAAKFHQYFLGTGEACGIRPLSISLSEYFNSQQNPDLFNKFYLTTYKIPNPSELETVSLMTAYSPGSRRGASEEGISSTPFNSGAPKTALRNSYSTKFIATEKVVKGGYANYNEKGLYYEQTPYGSSPGDLSSLIDGSFDNMLPSSALSEWRGQLFY